MFNRAYSKNKDMRKKGAALFLGTGRGFPSANIEIIESARKYGY
jgi:hypothetical protein